VASKGHDDHHDGHLSHVATWQTLIGTLVALLILTAITVGAAYVDFGGRSINLAIAMLIATIKVSLVVLYFMHLRYDRLFNTVIFVAALLGAILFVGFSLMDRGQYEQDVVWDIDNPPQLKPNIKPQ